MKQTNVSLSDAAAILMNALPKGVLLTSAADGVDNTMTIGWGAIGVDWSEPIFIAFVREGRYTRELLDKNPEFTVNIPGPDTARALIGKAGTQTGRGASKIDDLGLTRVDSTKVSVPSLKEFPLTIECRLEYRQPQDLSLLPEEMVAKFYPQDVGSENCGANKDAHVAYYGRIEAITLLQDD